VYVYLYKHTDERLYIHTNASHISKRASDGWMHAQRWMAAWPYVPVCAAFFSSMRSCAYHMRVDLHSRVHRTDSQRARARADTARTLIQVHLLQGSNVVVPDQKLSERWHHVLHLILCVLRRVGSTRPQEHKRIHGCSRTHARAHARTLRSMSYSKACEVARRSSMELMKDAFPGLFAGLRIPC